MKSFMLALAAMGLIVGVGLAQTGGTQAGSKQTAGKQATQKQSTNKQNTQPQSTQPNQSRTTEKQGTQKTGTEPYLGVGVAPIPSALRSHMGKTLPKDEGVLVGQVAKDSPAAKAGLQVDDILLGFNNQKLHSPEDLVKAVHADRPGQEVNLDLIRAGKEMHVKAKLGEARRPQGNANDNERVFRVVPDERMRQLLQGINPKNDESAWESFDAIKLSRMPGNRWHAEIDYRDSQGKNVHKVFEGNREQLRKDIDAARDLPANERRHLERALNFQNPIFEFHFPPFDTSNPDF